MTAVLITLNEKSPKFKMILVYTSAAFLVLFQISLAAPTSDPTSCPIICPFIYLPLCGSDGKTYGNECALKADNCLYKTSVTQLYQGPCTKATTGAPEATTTPCRVACPRIYRPVCGSNGRTYPNECELNSYGCRNKLNLKIAHDGACSA